MGFYRAVLVGLLLVAISVFIHEGVHWVQMSMDSRVEPAKLMFFQGDNVMSVKPVWTTTDINEMIAFNLEDFETIAYLIQFSFLIVSYTIYLKEVR